MLAHRFVRRCAAGAACLAAFLLATVTSADAQQPLPGTQPLTWTGDLSLRMVDDLHAYADKATAASIERRARHWKRDFSSVEAYRKSIEGNRKRLAKYLGASDPTLPVTEPNPPRLLARADLGSSIGEGKLRDKGNKVTKIDHLVLSYSPDCEIEIDFLGGENLMDGPLVILLGDAGQGEVEMPGDAAPALGFVKRGYAVLALRLVDRGDDFSLVAGTKRRPQSHREYIYRQAFEMGRHVIGYELDALRKTLDFILQVNEDGKKRKVAVVGYGEGGLLALYAGALDPRIDVVGVSGYFGPREGLHDEPIYRNVWGLLDEFGDAELAAMIAPSRLIVEAAEVPTIKVDPKADVARITPGKLTTPKLSDVRREVDRALKITAGQAAFADRITLIDPNQPKKEPRSDPFIDAVAKACFDPQPVKVEPTNEHGYANRAFNFEPGPPEMKRLVNQYVERTQALVRESEYVRKDYFAKADKASRDPAKWEASLGPYRKHLHEEVLGKIDAPLLPPNARTRQVYDTPKYVGYEVVLDVFDNDAEKADANVFAFGVLLVPKDLKAGEKRPVVVCQHGLEGRPRDTIEAGIEGERYYHRFAHHLAERGFVTFSPQNPYIGKNHFRQLVRKLNPLKLSLWSIIVPQHEQITSWLATLPFVDGERIGFYGLSYGGKTAMRVPALVTRYCLSICSGDFNEWIRKCTSVRDPFSYMGTGEYEMFEFNLGHTFNYAEMAYLIAPRPFMVERGHRDGVGIDEWVGYEYGKVRLLYADLKIPERTEIEYFDGPHECHNVGTFDFLHRHLRHAVPK